MEYIQKGAVVHHVAFVYYFNGIFFVLILEVDMDA